MSENKHFDMSKPGEGFSPPYVFDFSAAVTKARQDYPELTRNVTFIDLSQPEARQQMLAEISKISPPPSEEQVKTFLAEFDVSKNGDGFVNDCGGMTFLFSASRPQHGFFARKLPHNAAAYTFTHELGHIVVKGGRFSQAGSPAVNQWAENFSENIADSFAIITGLSEGWLTPDHVLRISLERSMNGWISRDMNHITTIALDNIVLRAEEIAPPSLSPAEIAAISHRHALEFTLPRGSMSYTFNELSAHSPADRLSALESVGSLAFESASSQESLAAEMTDIIQRHTRIVAEACMEEPHTSAAFHLYGRIVAKVLRNNKVEGVPVDTSDPYWDKVRKDLVEKSYAAGLSDIFMIEHPEVPPPKKKVAPSTRSGNHFKNQA